jgi:hypothetical protein
MVQHEGRFFQKKISERNLPRRDLAPKRKTFVDPKPSKEKFAKRDSKLLDSLPCILKHNFIFPCA